MTEGCRRKWPMGIAMGSILALCVVPAAAVAQEVAEPELAKPELESLSIEELMRVQVVTATREKVSLAGAPATIWVIMAKEIEERGYEFLDEALRDLPGIDFVRVHGAFPTIFAVRGSYGDENRRLLVMVDGHVVNSLHGGFELGGPAFSLHNVARIEVILGPASALYGANAFTSVVNVVTKQGQEHEGFSYHKGYGSFHTTVDRFSLVASQGSFDLSLSGSLYSTEGPRFTSRHPNFQDAYVDQAHSLVGRFTYRAPKNVTTLGFHALGTPMGDGTFGNVPNQALGLPGREHMNDSSVGYLPFLVGGERPSLWYPFSYTLFLTNAYHFSDAVTLNANLRHVRTGLDDDSYSYFLGADGIIDRNKWTNDSHRLGGEASLRLRLSERQSLVAGVAYTRDNLESGLRPKEPDPQVVLVQGLAIRNLQSRFAERVFTLQHNVAGYSEYSLATSLFGSTAFTLGARFDQNSAFGFVFNPRGGIVVRPVERLSVKLLAGTAYRAPTTFELYARAPVREPNPDLRPERIQTYEVGMSLELGSTLWQANLFYSRMSDLIVSLVPVGGAVGKNQNAGEGALLGGELAFRGVAGPFKAFANLTAQRARQRSDGAWSDIPNVARLKANAGVNVSIDDFVGVDLIGNWVGERTVPATNPLGRVPGYFVAHLAVTTARFFRHMFRASLTLQNVLDNTYVDPGIRGAEGSQAFATVNEQPGFRALAKIVAEY